MFALRESHSDVLLELGGGANPVVHPRVMGGRDVNVDVRDCHTPDGRKTTDLVADLEKPIALEEQFDTVVSRYVIEHLSWRRVRDFVREIYRLCKASGRAVVITANTQAQLKWIQDHPEGWDGKPYFESASCVLFGDQDYPENTHKNYMCVSTIKDLFSEAGFTDIVVEPFGERKTDLILSARKPCASVSAVSPETSALKKLAVESEVRAELRREEPLAEAGAPLLKAVSTEVLDKWQSPFVSDKDDRNKSVYDRASAGASGESAVAALMPSASRLGVNVIHSQSENGPRSMYHPDLDDASRSLFNEMYELFESQLVRLFTREGDTVLDVGAHIGHYTLLLADAVGPKGSVLAFEPFLPNVDMLRKNVRDNDLHERVKVLPYALLDNNRSSALFFNPKNSGDNRLWLVEHWPHISVECRTLDSVLDASSHVDLVKIDVRGAEMRVLKGMRNLLEAQKRVVVFVEMWPLGLRYMDNTLQEFADFFKGWRQGFMIYEDPPKLVPINSLDGLVKPQSSHFVNLIFVK